MRQGRSEANRRRVGARSAAMQTVLRGRRRGRRSTSRTIRLCQMVFFCSEEGQADTVVNLR